MHGYSTERIFTIRDGRWHLGLGGDLRILGGESSRHLDHRAACTLWPLVAGNLALLHSMLPLLILVPPWLPGRLPIAAALGGAGSCSSTACGSQPRSGCSRTWVRFCSDSHD